MGSVTLELAQEAFGQWRAQRSSCAEAIPERLWSMAIELYPRYKRSKICEQLQLSGGQFKRRLEGAKDRLVDSGFVLASNIKANANTKPSCEVQMRIQGQGRALTLYVDVNMMGQILPHLVGLL